LEEALRVVHRTRRSRCFHRLNSPTPGGQWKYPAGLRAALERERGERLPPAERRSFQQAQQRLRREAPEEFHDELDTIDWLTVPLLPARTHQVGGADRTAHQIVDRTRRLTLPARTEPPSRTAARGEAETALAAQQLEDDERRLDPDRTDPVDRDLEGDRDL